MTTPSTRSHQWEPEELLRLAERVEKATGPDEVLDGAIWLAACADEASLKAYKAGLAISRNEAAFRLSYMSGGFMPTASVDAAMTLADGLGGEVTFFKDGTAKAFLWQPYPMAIEAKAATPALALTAAALRARASTPPEGHNGE